MTQPSSYLRFSTIRTAVRIVLEALADHEAVPPPDPATRPDRSSPTLPPRPGA